MSHAWINGEFLPQDAAAVGISDAGLLHAAGVFTTMRAAGGRVVRLDLHLARLRRSCEALYVPLQFDDASLSAAVAGLLERNGLAAGDARMRLTVTRGHSIRDPLHGESFRPTCFMTAEELAP